MEGQWPDDEEPEDDEEKWRFLCGFYIRKNCLLNWWREEVIRDGKEKKDCKKEEEIDCWIDDFSIS